MSGQRLVQMANDIAAFFAAEPDPDAATLGVESHLRKFWSPRMRAQLIEQWRRDASALAPLATAAVIRLAQTERINDAQSQP